MPDTKIYEDRFTQEQRNAINDINQTPEKIKRGEFYRNEYYTLSGEQVTRLSEWEELEKHYMCIREVTNEDDPNSFIPVTNPIINGQISAMVEKNISATARGRGVSDSAFQHTVQILTDLLVDELNVKKLIKEGAKPYLLFGNGVFAVSYDPDYFRGGSGAIIGFPEIRCPQIGNVLVDGKIKNMTDYQKAEWIIEEIGFKSIDWVRINYGDEIADSVTQLNHNYHFDGDVSGDDQNAVSLLYVWTRNNKSHNLQRIVMDKRGVIFEVSDPKTPFYDFVNNRYPFFFFGMYQQEGHFYRFGDGLVLKFIQNTINHLIDEIIIACMYSAQTQLLVDPQAETDIDQFDQNPHVPRIVRNPHTNVLMVQGGGINPVVERLLSMLLNEAQKAARFGVLMNGNQPAEQMTATQAGIQVQQGNVTMNDKRYDISDAMGDALCYCIGLLMEFWPAAEAVRVTKDKEDFEWVDVSQLAKIPVMVPADNEFRNSFKSRYPNSPVEMIPKWMQLQTEIVNEDGSAALESATKFIDFDIDMSIGEGLPSNKLSIFNVLLALSKLVLIDEKTNQPAPVIGREYFMQLASDMLGMTLKDAQMEAQKQGVGMGFNDKGGVVPTQVVANSANSNGNPNSNQMYGAFNQAPSYIPNAPAPNIPVAL
jgi:hypothetical protein